MVSTHHSVVIETLILAYTRDHANVRPRLQSVPLLKRTISSDSGVDEMLSDEESSIHYTSKPSPTPGPQTSPSPQPQASPTNQSNTEPSSSSIPQAVSSPNPSCSPNPKTDSTTTSSPLPTDSPSESIDPNIDPLSLSQEPSTSGHCASSSEQASYSEQGEALTVSECNEASLSEYGTECTEFSTSSVTEKFSTEASNLCVVPHLVDSVEAFLSVMPEYTQSRLAGYSEYLHDAHLQVQEGLTQWCWVSQLVPEGDSEGVLDEGVLLRALINMTENIPYQTYSVNLLLMAVLSEICYIPHPSVTIYLLDTTLPSPTLYTQLKDVATTFSDILAASPSLAEGLKNVSSGDCIDVCKAVYLTEEFCKELAAISLVKSTSC